MLSTRKTGCRLSCGVASELELVNKNSADLQRHVEENWVKMCQNIGTLLAERVMDGREDQVCNASTVAGLYVQS